MMQLGLTPEQIAERRLGIGGSDVKRMLDDPVGLWKEKLGLVEPEDLSGNLAVQMGSATEAFNAFWFTKITGRPVTHRNDLLVNPTAPWMRANLDGLTTTAKGRRAYWDAKHVGRSDEQMILRYTPQMTHCCAVLEANGLPTDWWILSVFVGNSKHEIIEQEVDPLYTEELIEKEREFWGYVERREAPPEPTRDVLPPKPTPKLREVVLDFDHPTENWQGAIIPAVRRFAETHGAAAVHAIARDEIKSLLPDDVGLCHAGLVEMKRSKAGALTIAMRKVTVEDERKP